MFPDLGLTIESDGTPLQQIETAQVIDLFKRHGVLGFAGFGADLRAFEEFTNRFSDDYMSHEGGGSVREVVNRDGDQTIMSVAYSYNAESQHSFPLALHSDRSYTKSQPPIMWFCCKQPSDKEGETTVADGRTFCQELSESTRRFFLANPIKYVRRYKDGEWQLLWQTDSRERVAEYARQNDMQFVAHDDGSVQTEYQTYAIRKSKWGNEDVFVNSMLLVEWQESVLKRSDTTAIRMADGSKISDAIWDELKGLADALTRYVVWNPGDFIMLDNTRMLHGRRAFTDPKREIWVRMCRTVNW
jgi:alpha-ketoglutarate-dependent taurine dioxygenase